MKGYAEIEMPWTKGVNDGWQGVTGVKRGTPIYSYGIRHGKHERDDGDGWVVTEANGTWLVGKASAPWMGSISMSIFPRPVPLKGKTMQERIDHATAHVLKHLNLGI